MSLKKVMGFIVNTCVFEHASFSVEFPPVAFYPSVSVVLSVKIVCQAAEQCNLPNSCTELLFEALGGLWGDKIAILVILLARRNAGRDYFFTLR